jgi:hypothetical protein
MCFSFKTSIVSYTLGLISTAFAFITRQYVLGTLILFYCQMQLSEALIWKGIDTDDISLNRLGTNYGKYLLPTHGLAIGIGLIISIVILQNRKPKLLEYIPLIIGIILYLYVVLGPYRNNTYPDLTYPTNKCGDKDCQNPNNRLKWPFPHFWYVITFIMFVIIGLIFIKPLKSKIYILSLFSISFLLSYILFPKNVGSFWCFVAAILAPILVIGNYYIIKEADDKHILT